MLFARFTLGVALVISAIAAYYSVVGLTAIFAAAVIPVIIMGTALEIGKITAAVWLKLNWARAQVTYKLYLVPAVALLMFLTSMGIFGFLSKAHLDQTSANTESIAQIERLTAEIKRRQEIVARAEEKIRALESSGTGQDAQIQSQIDREQARIDSAYKRIEPAIQEQNAIIGAQNKLYSDQIEKIDRDLAQLQSLLEKNEIAKAQALVGVQPDGRIGPRTTEAFRSYQNRLTAQRQEIAQQLEQSNRNPAIQAARAEIQRLRRTVETQVADSNTLINRLRQQVGKGPTQNIDALVDEQQVRIRTANQEIDQFTEKKYELESQNRKLEAEVGPVKYIAQLIYGDNPDANLLEQAVRWVIIVIVAVFDPLALVLILAAQQSFRWAKEDRLNPRYKQDDGPLTDNQVEQVQDSVFNANEHEYLNRPWKFVPSGDPLVAKETDKEIGICAICSSELIDGNELGAICSNTDCSSYHITTEDQFEKLDVTANITLMSDSTVAIDSIKELHIEPELVSIPQEQVDTSPKVVEARRSFKAPMTSVPEAMNVRKKLVPVADNEVNKSVKSSFGTLFPNDANSGDFFLRVDFNPNRLYKYNGQKWIEIDKNKTDTYSYDEKYIDFLIDKIKSGEYEIEQLSESEQDQIQLRLQNQSNGTT